MRDVGDEGNDFFAFEHRRNHIDVGQMRAAAVVGVVGDKHIAGQNFAHRKALQNFGHRTDHRAQVYRHALRQRDHFARHVKNRGRTIRALLDVGRKRRAHQRRGHFLGGGEQKARDDFGFDGVDFAFHGTLSVNESDQSRSY